MIARCTGHRTTRDGRVELWAYGDLVVGVDAERSFATVSRAGEDGLARIASTGRVEGATAVGIRDAALAAMGLEHGRGEAEMTEGGTSAAEAARAVASRMVAQGEGRLEEFRVPASCVHRAPDGWLVDMPQGSRVRGLGPGGTDLVASGYLMRAAVSRPAGGYWASVALPALAEVTLARRCDPENRVSALGEDVARACREWERTVGRRERSREVALTLPGFCWDGSGRSVTMPAGMALDVVSVDGEERPCCGLRVDGWELECEEVTPTEDGTRVTCRVRGDANARLAGKGRRATARPDALSRAAEECAASKVSFDVPALAVTERRGRDGGAYVEVEVPAPVLRALTGREAGRAYFCVAESGAAPRGDEVRAYLRRGATVNVKSLETRRNIAAVGAEELARGMSDRCRAYDRRRDRAAAEAARGAMNPYFTAEAGTFEPAEVSVRRDPSGLGDAYTAGEAALESVDGWRVSVPGARVEAADGRAVELGAFTVDVPASMCSEQEDGSIVCTLARGSRVRVEDERGEAVTVGAAELACALGGERNSISRALSRQRRR